MIDVDAGADPRVVRHGLDGLAHVERLAEQRQATAVRRIDRMQGLERDLHPDLLAMFAQQCRAFHDLPPRARDVLGARWHRTHHHHEVLGTECHRIVDGTAVGGDVRFKTGAIRRRNIGATAVAGDGELGVADAFGDDGGVPALDLATPWRDAAEARARHRVDHFFNGRLKTQRRRVDGAEFRMKPQITHHTPWTASSCFMRLIASVGSWSNPAWSASRKTSLKYGKGRIAWAPATMTK